MRNVFWLKNICLGTQENNNSLAYNILSHLRDLAPLIFRKVKAARHYLLPHVFWDGSTVMLGVERWIAAQHYVDNHTQRPQVTALQGANKYRFKHQLSAQHFLSICSLRMTHFWLEPHFVICIGSWRGRYNSRLFFLVSSLSLEYLKDNKM